MELRVSLNLLFVFSLIFLIIIKSFFLLRAALMGRKRSLWKCMQCGECCKVYKVRLSEDDIKRIERAGYSRKHFVNKNRLLKKVNGLCVFQKIRNGISVCTVHKIKPERCRRFPFFRVSDRIYIVRSMKCPGIKKLSS